MKLVSMGLQFIYNKVNFVENPRSGLMLHIDCSTGKKTIIKNSALEDDLYTNIEMTSARVKAIADISFFVPLGLNSAIMLRTYNGMLVAEDVFENEMFRLGGLFNMRGFDEEQFYSTAFGLQSVEYRYLFSELSRFVVFVDYSYIEKRTDEALTIYRPLSAGAGVTLETNSGLFSLFWAVGKMYNQPPDFRGSKIHFGYMVLF
jgi:translocation and assembly module TamA